MSEFTFVTLQYESGDWDSAPLLPSNIIDTIARYTSIPVTPSGVIVPLASPDLMRFPFAFLTGHLPVRFTSAERDRLREWIARGGFLFVDDHNHDIDGAFHKTVTEEIARAVGPLVELPNSNALYKSFFTFADGPPAKALPRRAPHAVRVDDRGAKAAVEDQHERDAGRARRENALSTANVN